MDDREIKSRAVEKIFSELDLHSENSPDPRNWISENDEMILLTKRIEELLHSNTEKIKQILYRIDVDESRLGNLLSQCRPGEEAQIIASEIVERQVAKIKTRIQYREGKL